MRTTRWILPTWIALSACATDGTSKPNGNGEPEVVEAHVREVRFESAAPDAFLHVGDLHVPEWRVGERLPAVVVAHGSGPHGRDGVVEGQLGMRFGFSIPVYREIAQGLQAAGFVVLTYDKRTCGRWSNCPTNDYELAKAMGSTVRIFSQDLAGGVRFLAEQPEVDPERIFVIGHSKGALYVPDVMQREARVRAGVMLAGTHSDFDDILAYQVDFVERLLRDLGYGEETIEEQVGSLRLTVEALRELKAGTWGTDPIDGLSIDYWQALLDMGKEARAGAPAMDRPILALSGDKDTNVPPSETEAWAREFEGTIHQAKILPCVTHAMNCIQGMEVGKNVSPAVIEALVDFFRSVEN